LRTPLSAQWGLADALVLIGDGDAGAAVAREAAERGKPVLRASLRPEADTAARLQGRRVLAFAGIGRPEKFFATLEASGVVIARRRSFPDHHPYKPAEVGKLLEEARAEALLPVTTEKDLVRIAALGPELAQAITALPVALVFADDEALQGRLRAVASRQRSPD
jgi:tetraacyldisaccharide 4'-kinase